ncbi:MAG: DegT/DnrJ/EryC1/StrS family aminotransferase [Pirellulaceae bacterium]
MACARATTTPQLASTAGSIHCKPPRYLSKFSTCSNIPPRDKKTRNATSNCFNKQAWQTCAAIVRSAFPITILPHSMFGISSVAHWQWSARSFRSYLQQRNIGSEIYYPIPLHQQVCFRDCGYADGSLPHTERAAAEILHLPIYPELTRIEQEQVVAAIASYYREAYRSKAS